MSRRHPDTCLYSIHSFKVILLAFDPKGSICNISCYNIIIPLKHDLYSTVTAKQLTFNFSCPHPRRLKNFFSLPPIVILTLQVRWSDAVREVSWLTSERDTLPTAQAASASRHSPSKTHHTQLHLANVHVPQLQTTSASLVTWNIIELRPPESSSIFISASKQNM